MTPQSSVFRIFHLPVRGYFGDFVVTIPKKANFGHLWQFGDPLTPRFGPQSLRASLWISPHFWAILANDGHLKRSFLANLDPPILPILCPKPFQDWPSARLANLGHSWQIWEP